MAGDPCIIWRPFPRAGSSPSSTGRTSVPHSGAEILVRHGPAWLLIIPQGRGTRCVNHEMRAVSIRGDSHWDDRHDLLFMLSPFIW